MLHSSPLYAPDGMTSGGRTPEHFDDGLVHNHQWAVTAHETYPSHGQGSTESNRGRILTGAEASPFQSRGQAIYSQDRHDDGLVHNHEWAVSGK